MLRALRGLTLALSLGGSQRLRTSWCVAGAHTIDPPNTVNPVTTAKDIVVCCGSEA